MHEHRCSDIYSLKVVLLADSGILVQAITIPATGTIDFSYHSSVHNLYVGSSPYAFTTQICPAEDASVISTSAPCKYTPGKPGAPSLLMCKQFCCRRCCYLLSLSRGGKAKVSICICCLVKSHSRLIASSSISNTSTDKPHGYGRVPSDSNSLSIAQLSQERLHM